jgi:hypothetical protein
MTIQKVDAIAVPIIKYFENLSKNEQEIFRLEGQFFEDLHEIFSAEISGRFKRGFIARYFF